MTIADFITFTFESLLFYTILSLAAAILSIPVYLYLFKRNALFLKDYFLLAYSLIIWHVLLFVPYFCNTMQGMVGGPILLSMMSLVINYSKIPAIKYFSPRNISIISIIVLSILTVTFSFSCNYIWDW